MPIALVGVDKQPSVQQAPTAQAAVPEGQAVPPQHQNGEQGGGNANDQPRFISPVIRVDQSGLAVLQFRDGDTGEKTQQYPSEKAIREYRQFAQVENDVGAGAVVDNGETASTGQGDTGAGGSSAAGSGSGGGETPGGFGSGGSGLGGSTGGGSGSGGGTSTGTGPGSGGGGKSGSGTTASGAAGGGSSGHVSIKA